MGRVLGQFLECSVGMSAAVLFLPVLSPLLPKRYRADSLLFCRVAMKASILPPSAAASGTVLRAIDTKGSNGYGNTVVLDHGNGYQTVYAHCQEILVQAGDAVNQGDVITLVGTTGLTTGSHCHLKLRLNGEK